jgi:hypothetical protein
MHRHTLCTVRRSAITSASLALFNKQAAMKSSLKLGSIALVLASAAMLLASIAHAMPEKYTFCGGNYTQDEQYEESPIYFVFRYDEASKTFVEVTNYQIIGKTGPTEKGFVQLSLLFQNPGEYIVGAQYTPFITASQRIQVSMRLAGVDLEPRNLVEDKRDIAIMSVNNAPVPEAEVFFPSYNDAASPYIAPVSSHNGAASSVTLTCYNYLEYNVGIPIYAFDKAYGTFDGSIDPNTAIITLSLKTKAKQ